MAVASLASVAAACGDPAARVTLVPLGGRCGQPTGANLVKVTAYASSGEPSRSLQLDQSISIADFPADTEQIGVEVIIGGGVIGAAGKSAPLGADGFLGLPDRATIPVFMAPPDGFCEIGPMTAARARPLVARAGDGVLVVGGQGETGPLLTAEYYDARTATFSAVAVPDGLDDPQSFTGMASATLPDGRVVLLGGAARALLVFDPAQRAFTVGPQLIAARAFHAAIATGARDVVVAGGCNGIDTSQCGGGHQVLRYHVDPAGNPDVEGLPMTSGARIGAQLFDLGVQLDGHHSYLLAGGTGDPGLADRFELADAAVAVLPGGQAQPVALDGGAVLVAFADDASPPDGTAAVYAPGAAAAQAIAKAPSLRGMRLVVLEDGRVAGFGDPGGGVLIYDPTRDAWRLAGTDPTTDQPGALTSPAVVRLADGSVLVLGGAVSNRAWLYRPSLVGPGSGSVTATPNSDSARGVLTAPDPTTVTRTRTPATWVLAAPGDALTARALVGGPRVATGSVGAVVHVLAGGVALIAQQTAPGQAVVVELAPGQPPRLIQLDAGAPRTICSGAAATAAFDPAIAVTLRLLISDHDARLTLNDGEVLACDLRATARGAWGVAALGAGARVAVDSVTVAR